MRYDWNLKSTILSYHGRQNGSKRAENGTKSALMKIEQKIDKAKISAQSRSRRFSVAPMMGWTDRHCRFFHRLLTRRALLYTEMLTTGAVRHGDRKRLLRFDAAENPVALQLGGSDPQALAACARIGADLGFDEINLNVGCPSDRVQDGRFGACLMAEPVLVGDCVAAMKAAVRIPVTVKCRIGVDEQDPEEALETFTQNVERAGTDALIVHARKAWLKGLSPKENREVPPLDYQRVYRLNAAHPRLRVVINGGIGSVEQALDHLQYVDGIMMGRAAYQEPWRLLAVDPEIFGEASRFVSAKQAAAALMPYIERELGQGTRLHSITRHLHGLFRAMPGARAYRRQLAGAASAPGAGAEYLMAALALVRDGELTDAAA
jgi:tRNA-dihydrouridine synthase A